MPLASVELRGSAKKIGINGPYKVSKGGFIGKHLSAKVKFLVNASSHAYEHECDRTCVTMEIKTKAKATGNFSRQEDYTQQQLSWNSCPITGSNQ